MKTSARGTGDGSRAFVFLDPVVGTFELFPIFLKLAGRPVLVVGGGVVAAGKIEALRAAGADITVVAPKVSEPIRATGVRVVERGFEPADLEGQWLVIAAATPEVNRMVAEKSEPRCLFVNAVDDPANASAYLGGVLRRDGVAIAISTNGRAPALAGLLREGLDTMLPHDLDEWFRQADELKRVWRSTGVPMEARRPQLLEALMKLYEASNSEPARTERGVGGPASERVRGSAGAKPPGHEDRS